MTVRQAELQERPAIDHAEIIVVGLGNPILGDDGVGWRVAEQVLASLKANNPSLCPNVVVELLSVGGLALMERMLDFKRAIVIDAVRIGEGTAGNLLCLPLSALPDHSTGHTTSAHDTSLQNALMLAQEMGFNVPEEVWVVGVEAKDTLEFSEQLSPAVEAAVPEATDTVLRLLLNGDGEVDDHDLT
jgi:hydrogenase maturation protease